MAKPFDEPPPIPVGAPERVTRRRPPWERGPIGLLLAPLGLAYGAFMDFRRSLYRRGVLGTTRFPLPVISVGNLTVGGTGKTPLVSAIIDALPEESTPALVVSRGYGAQVERDGVVLNDEGWMLRLRHPNHHFVQGADRAKTIAAALAGPCADARVVILDDGAQHLSVARDLDIFVIDARELLVPVRCLPAGPWREKLAVAAAADVIVLTRCDQIELRTLARIEAVMKRAAPGKPVFLTRHAPTALRDPETGVEDLGFDLYGATVGLVSGIGSPETFAQTVLNLGAAVAWRLDFGDHHEYIDADRERIVRRFQEAPVDLVLTTEKDILKLEGLGIPISVLVVDLDFGLGSEAFRRIVAERLVVRF